MPHAAVYRQGDMVWLVAKVVRGDLGEIVSVAFADGGFAMVDKKVIERIEEPRFCIGDYVRETHAAALGGIRENGVIVAIHGRRLWIENVSGAMITRGMDLVDRVALAEPKAPVVTDGEAI